jgi:short-subunit dehydrogenase
MAPRSVVTGASSGIGRALAREFAEHGFDVLITAEDHDGLREVERELESTGVRVTSVAVDLRDPQGVEALATAVEAAGPVDAIAFNAGVASSGGFASGPDLKDELDVVAVNVTSQVHLARRVLPGMVRRGQGRVLFTSSVSALAPAPYLAVYAASKAFVLSFAEALRHELRNSGVTVTALLPGPTDSEIFERSGMEDTRLGADPHKSEPDDIARQAFEALMEGKDKVVAGRLRDRVMSAASEVLPEPVKARLHATQTRPGSARD